MCIGESWQNLAGGMPQWTNLGKGHHTGLDLLDESSVIGIELKNSTKTDNHSSRKSNICKLQRFKHTHMVVELYMVV